MGSGKRIRLQRIFSRASGRTVIVPMDHGISSGPITGLTDAVASLRAISRGGADAVILHKGLVPAYAELLENAPSLIVHLSASTELSLFPNSKVLITTVEEALALGADAVSVQVNLGDENESTMLHDLGTVVRRAGRFDMPVLAMVYARGARIKNEFEGAVVAHCARVGAECGADIVKVPYTGSVESFARVVEGCCCPVIIAGGKRMGTAQELFTMVKDSLLAGGAGLSVGRNVFQNGRPDLMTRALQLLVHQNSDITAALAVLASGGDYD